MYKKKNKDVKRLFEIFVRYIRSIDLASDTFIRLCEYIKVKIYDCLYMYKRKIMERKNIS